MKNFFIVIIVSILPACAISQSVISYTEKSIAFIEHAVAKSEGLQSIATRYKANYSDVLKLNGFAKAVSLKEGQLLKIPISQLIKATCEGPDCIKVYYTVKASEGLYRIGVNFGNIKMAQLKALNNFTNETVSIGQQIQVGFLPLSANSIKTGLTNAFVAAQNSVTEAPPVVKPTAAAEANKAIVAKPVMTEDTVPVITKIKSTSQQIVVEAKTELVKPVEQQIAGPDLSKGFFAPQFAKGIKELYGLAASFKSESGWTDNKFYILINGVAAGTVVKVLLPGGGKYIFAKVLGTLPQVKENENVKFRLNNAGATMLGVGNLDTFSVTVQF